MRRRTATAATVTAVGAATLRAGTGTAADGGAAPACPPEDGRGRIALALGDGFVGRLARGPGASSASLVTTIAIAIAITATSLGEGTPGSRDARFDSNGKADNRNGEKAAVPLFHETGVDREREAYRLATAAVAAAGAGGWPGRTTTLRGDFPLTQKSGFQIVATATAIALAKIAPRLPPRALAPRVAPSAGDNRATTTGMAGRARHSATAGGGSDLSLGVRGHGLGITIPKHRTTVVEDLRLPAAPHLPLPVLLLLRRAKAVDSGEAATIRGVQAASGGTGGEAAGGHGVGATSRPPLATVSETEAETSMQEEAALGEGVEVATAGEPASVPLPGVPRTRRRYRHQATPETIPEAVPASAEGGEKASRTACGGGFWQCLGESPVESSPR